MLGVVVVSVIVSTAVSVIVSTKVADLDVGLVGGSGQQGSFNLAPGDILGVQNPPFGVSALLAQVEFTGTVGSGDLALGKLHAAGQQLRDSRGPLLDDRPHDLLPAQTRAGFQRVTHVHLEGIFLLSHRGDASLIVVGIGLGAVLLGDMNGNNLVSYLSCLIIYLDEISR